MTITPKDILGHISGGRALDVATGNGGFIHFLIEGLRDYAEILGVDANAAAASAFAEAFRDKPAVYFQCKDAAQLDFDDSTFDLVSISNSLHHLDPTPVLHQMMRVLRPGGTLLVSEMYCDDQTETQMTHVHLHHWWAAVDRVNEIQHRETYRRSELIEMVSSLGLQNEAYYDLSDLQSDPKDRGLMAELDSVFDRYIQRAHGHPELQARGMELRERVNEIGFHSATTLVVLGQKP